MFHSSFYNALDPMYREKLLLLVQRIKEIEKKGGKGLRKKVFELLNEFSSQYLMPNLLWKKKIGIIQGFNGIDIHRIASLYFFNFGHLSKSEQQILNVRNLRRKKLCERPENEYRVPVELLVENFCYPHVELEENWREYVLYQAESLIPKAVYQRYEKMKFLYYKIVTVKEDIKEWIKALIESDDYEFVVDNVEFRLSENLGNKELWKLYIRFLQKNGHHKKLLETYSKYSRLFLEDSKMLKEYQKAAKIFGPSFVPWKNTKSFEIFDENFFNVSEIPAASVKAVAPSPLCHLDSVTVSPQKFSFKQSLFDYIFDNAKASVLFALYKTCKWFYCSFQVEIIYSFNATAEMTNVIRKQAIKISHPNFLKVDYKIYVSSVFIFHIPEVKALTNFMPNIYRCTATYIIINNQHLTFKELKMLIGHGEVIELNMSAKDQNGKPFKFEEIITLLPKIQRLDICDTVCPANISQILLDFSFQNKILSFRFGCVKILPDPYAFAEFILKNASPNHFSFFTFSCDRIFNIIPYGVNVFDDEEEKRDFRRFESTVNNIIVEKWKGHKRPYFNI